jgi:membrane protein implicated in regulation of membrane protease activity
MAGWLLWLIVACVLGLGEVLTGRAFARPWALGAALAAAADAAGAPGYLPWVIFLLGYASARPFIALIGQRRSARAAVTRPIRSDPMVGKQGVVLEQIANRDGMGCIELEGEIWTARAFDRDKVIDAGVQVTVVDVRGATALVSD